MLTAEGESEYKKWEKWISDENFQLSPTFVPTEETPRAGAVEYCKDTCRSFFPMIDFDLLSFKWPVGIGINL
jgi:hypothetical protein